MRRCPALTVMVFGGQFLSPLLGQAVSAQVGLVRTFDVFAGLLIVVAVALLVRGGRARGEGRRAGGQGRGFSGRRPVP